MQPAKKRKKDSISAIKTNQMGVVKNRKSLKLQSDSNTIVIDEGNYGDNGNYGNEDNYGNYGDAGNTDNYSDVGNYGNYGDSTQYIPSSIRSSSDVGNYGNYGRSSIDVLRLNVSVEGMTYLVPCNRYHDNQPSTVASLTDKVCDRYMLQNGRRPVLTLTNKDGAILCPTDNIIDVIKEEGEVLVGVVSYWDTIVFTEHYQNICKKYKTGN